MEQLSSLQIIPALLRHKAINLNRSFFLKTKKKKEKALQIADWTVSKTRIGAASVQLHSSEIRANVSMGAVALKDHPCRASLVPKAH